MFDRKTHITILMRVIESCNLEASTRDALKKLVQGFDGTHPKPQRVCLTVEVAPGAVQEFTDVEIRYMSDTTVVWTDKDGKEYVTSASYTTVYTSKEEYAIHLLSKISGLSEPLAADYLTKIGFIKEKSE